MNNRNIGIDVRPEKFEQDQVGRTGIFDGDFRDGPVVHYQELVAACVEVGIPGLYLMPALQPRPLPHEDVVHPRQDVSESFVRRADPIIYLCSGRPSLRPHGWKSLARQAVENLKSRCPRDGLSTEARVSSLPIWSNFTGKSVPGTVPGTGFQIQLTRKPPMPVSTRTVTRCFALS